jgi:hypothetical protein
MSIIQDLLNNGYENGVPRWTNMKDSEIDQEIAEKFPCIKCGGRMKWVPLINSAHKIYRCFSVCQNCEYEEEF